MRVLLVMIGLVLGMASANAAEVTSAGGTVLSSTGLPVMSGGAIIESEHEGRSEPAGRSDRGGSDNGGCEGHSS